MDSKQLLNKLRYEQIISLMTDYYGVEMDETQEDELTCKFRTDCHHPHGEGNFKLYFYKETKSFFCFSSCGSMSIFDIVMEFENISFHESITFLQEYFNIGMATRTFGRDKSKYEHKKYIHKEIDFNEPLKEYDDYILNTFIKTHPIQWLIEDISDKTMDKYEIMFDIDSNSIIMPHRDINNRLIGIRQRNIDKYQTDVLKRKYMPFTNYRSKIIYKHSLGRNLYGININKDMIKESKKCILWEAEKSVLKMDSIYDNNPSLAVGGSSVSEFQLHILKNIGIECVYLSFDKEDGNDEKWKNKIDKICKKIINFGFKCFVIEDTMDLLELKDSPIDNGRFVFETLLKNAREFIDNI